MNRSPILILAACFGLLTACGGQLPVQTVPETNLPLVNLDPRVQGEIVALAVPLDPNRGYLYEDDETNEPTGVDVDILQAWADSFELSLRIIVIQGNARDIMELLEEGRGHIALGALVKTLERSEHLLFSAAYTKADVVLVVPQESDCTGFKNLGGSRAVLFLESVYHDYLLRHGGDSLHFLDITKASHAANALLSGDADFHITSGTGAQQLIADNPSLRLCEKYEDALRVAFPMNPGLPPAMVNELNYQIEDLLSEEGGISRLLEEHGLLP